MRSTFDWPLVLLGVLYVGAFIVTWMNRASEKIVTAAVPIGLAGFLGILLSVFVFGAVEPLKVVFSSGFLVNLDDRMPVQLPSVFESKRFGWAYFEVKQLHDEHPELFQGQEDEFGSHLYHHVLQKETLDWLSQNYPFSWQVEKMPISFGGLTGAISSPEPGTKEKGRFYSSEELREALQGNWLASIRSPVGQGITLPPGSILRVAAPHTEENQLETAEALIANKYCTLRISTRPAMAIRNIGGYRLLLGLSNEDVRSLGFVVYVVTVQATFSRLRSGNPEMARYRKWANEVIAGLQTQFDEEIIWEKSRNDFLLYKHIEPAARGIK
jgi:hypothetical protein